jgi:hypothetical protein
MHNILEIKIKTQKQKKRIFETKPEEPQLAD